MGLHERHHLDRCRARSRHRLRVFASRPTTSSHGPTIPLPDLPHQPVPKPKHPRPGPSSRKSKKTKRPLFVPHPFIFRARQRFLRRDNRHLSNRLDKITNADRPRHRAWPHTQRRAAELFMEPPPRSLPAKNAFLANILLVIHRRGRQPLSRNTPTAHYQLPGHGI